MATPSRGVSGAAPGGRSWPSANAYSAAVQNPQSAFRDEALRGAVTARDRLGMPLVMSGNFAYVFKLVLAQGGARGVKCFRRPLGDREGRFQAIDAHLEAHAVDQIARFEYEGEGVQIGGAWYPALVMEWIEGPTLDVYVGELLKGPQAAAALRELAEQWGHLVAELQDAHIAHGDLQHGNVIVTAGGLRLVDLDGMFVPALRGRGAPDEVGHRHYQHPARTVRDFDETLDRFASIVIHASLLALADDPSLWRDFHDDNLVLERKDYLDPGTSRAFARFARLTGETARLTDVLTKACSGPLSGVPALTQLITVKRSKLPLWIRQPIVPTVAKKTREAAPGDVAPAGPAQPPPLPHPVPRTPPPLTPATPAPPVSWATPNPPAPPPPAPIAPRRPFGAIRKPLPAPQFGAGWPPEESPWRLSALVFLTLAIVGTVCSGWWGPIVAGLLGQSVGWTQVLFLGACAAATFLVVTWYVGDIRTWWARGRARAALRIPHAGGFIASPLLGVYHRPTCAIAKGIGARNRIWLLHAYEAHAGGFRPCPACNPQNP